MPVTRPYPQPPTRATITARCATISAQRLKMPVGGPAYEAATLALDNMLALLWAMGPNPNHDGT
jgi:hypothetical protein